jgi:protein involved in polysaccharide export with SLBB domain
VKKRFLFIAMAIACTAPITRGQVPEASSILDRLSDVRSLQSMLSRETGVDQVRGFPMEGAVDPLKYILGPSDVLNVGLWGPIANSYSVTVTPEGSIIVPTVGEIQVNQMKLADAKKEVIATVRRKYPTSNVTVSLLRPRSFLVSLRGSVPRPGQYTATPVDRLEKVLAEGSEALYSASTVTIPGITVQDGEPVPTKMDSYTAPIIKRKYRFAEETSTRNILVIRKHGDTLKADLPKFYATGEDRLNPFLFDGDVIQVPRRDIGRSFVSVLGAVNLPDDYEYAPGDRLLDLIGIAGGFSGVADQDQITLSRIDTEGNLISEEVYSAAAIRSGTQADQSLLRGDVVFVKTYPTVMKRFEVIVTGEVRNPGSYPILTGKTKLSSIIRNAGGLTDRALPAGAFLLRAQGKLKDIVDPRLELVRALRTHQLGLLDSLLYLVELKVGRDPVIVDFKKLLVDNDSTQDLVLQRDDIVYIPSDLDAVVVQGQVAQAGHVKFTAGKDYLYYIGKAGGFSEMADESEVRIIKRGSLQWIEPEGTTIESGDQIWVPKQPKKDFVYYYSWVREGVTLAASLFTVVYLIIVAGK